ncbi:MAG: hypothetical protein OXC62_04415 [Aestuariivita sp.]|nr:hypothetical protein [Aestuariivita sp.]
MAIKTEKYIVAWWQSSLFRKDTWKEITCYDFSEVVKLLAVEMRKSKRKKKLQDQIWVYREKEKDKNFDFYLQWSQNNQSWKWILNAQYARKYLKELEK